MKTSVATDEQEDPKVSRVDKNHKTSVVRITGHQGLTCILEPRKRGQECICFKQNREIRLIFSHISVLANVGFMKISQRCY